MTMKQIKISEKVYDELKSLMLDKETFNLVIQRILLENKSLKKDKDMLMKIAMQTDNSIAFHSMKHSLFFSIMEYIKENSYSNDEKLNYLKEYLKKNIEIDSDEVINVIKIIQEDYLIGNPKEDYNSRCLDDLRLWIEENYQS